MFRRVSAHGDDRFFAESELGGIRAAEQLRKKEEQLRMEKGQLRMEKEQLREKENLLLQANPTMLKRAKTGESGKHLFWCYFSQTLPFFAQHSSCHARFA